MNKLYIIIILISVFLYDCTEVSPVSNPYKGYTECYDPWRYELFEIYRGSKTVIFDDLLHFEREYSHLVKNKEEKLPDTLYEYKITLSQAIGNEPWMEQINTYYQGIMLELIDKCEDTWDEYCGD